MSIKGNQLMKLLKNHKESEAIFAKKRNLA